MASLTIPLVIQEQVPLAPYTTLGVGGPARFFVRVTDADELLEAVNFARTRDLPIFTLGGGSNLLVSDEGFPGLVLHIGINAPTERDGNLFRAAAGTDWDSFVREICEQEMSGVECLAGIPGLIGGCPIQNIGAYGQEAASTIDTVHAFDLTTLKTVDLPRSTCGFGYRTSMFNTSRRNRYIVTAVTFRFDTDAQPNLSYADLRCHFAGQPSPTPMEVYHAVRAIRQAKGMLLAEGDPDSRSAGSFFKNPIVPDATLAALAGVLHLDAAAIPHWPAGPGSVKLAAAWLAERAGFHKGYRLGAAGISSRHTLALINRGGATFADVVCLREMIRGEVQARFGIVLEQEPVQM